MTLSGIKVHSIGLERNALKSLKITRIKKMSFDIKL